MDDLERAWALVTGPGNQNVRSTELVRLLEASPDAVSIALACAERLASLDRALREAFGSVLAVAVAKRTEPGVPLDPRLDAVVGLLTRHGALDELVYGRTPPERLAPVLTRILAERPPHDEASVGHEILATLRRAPEATPAFFDYLRRQKMERRIAPGGDLAARFAQARAAVPRIDAHALAAMPTPRRSAKKPSSSIGPFEIVKVAEVRTAAEVEALGADRAAGFLAAARAIAGRKKIASIEAAFARPLREGEASPAAVLHEVRDEEPRYELWTFFGDTGVLFARGTVKTVGVDWVQGEFEARRPAQEPLARALATARWR